MAARDLILLYLGLLFFACPLICKGGKNKYRRPVINYPKDTIFWATDFFERGCKNFLEKCPMVYKVQHICAKSYNDEYRDFANYCEMQYENCNTWRNWRVFKRERC